jgi:ABC-type dipeptide/oligopeptide/nickel transport system permease component
MGRFLIKRLTGALVVLLLVSLMSFALIWLVPGDATAAFLDAGATPEQVAQLRTALGLDQPLPMQMAHWYWRVLHGDLGQSILLNRSVAAALVERLPVTLSLAALALAFAVAIGVAAGIVAAVNHNRWPDQAVMSAALFGLSVPDFWLGLVLILVFAVSFGWLPTGGFVPITESVEGWVRTVTLPALTLGLVQVGFIARMARASMLEVLGQDFMRTADAKGLSRLDIVVRHGSQRAHPHTDGHWYRCRRVARRHGHHRTGLLNPWHRAPHHWRRCRTRLPRHAGRPLVPGSRLPDRQSGRRCALRGRRSAREVGVTAVESLAEAAAGGPAGGHSPARETIRRLLKNRSFVIGAVLVLTVATIAISADWLAPFDPLKSNVRLRLQPPSLAHWFGTDHFGRDLLSRVMSGARVSLAIGGMVAVATGIAGTVIGALAGFYGRLDHPIMRLMDALMAFPSIVLAMVVSATLGASLTNVVIALAIATTPHTARVVRASVIVGRELDYVEAARALGAGDMRVLFRHVLRIRWGR